MNNKYSKPKSRLKNPAFLKELLNLIIIEFRAALESPEWEQFIPSPEAIVRDVENGIPIMYRSWLDTILNRIADNFVLTEDERKELRAMIFRLNE